MSRILENSASGLTLTEETKSENKDDDLSYFNYSPDLINPETPAIGQDYNDNVSSELTTSPFTLKRGNKLKINVKPTIK